MNEEISLFIEPNDMERTIEVLLHSNDCDCVVVKDETRIEESGDHAYFIKGYRLIGHIGETK